MNQIERIQYDSPVISASPITDKRRLSLHNQRKQLRKSLRNTPVVIRNNQNNNDQNDDTEDDTEQLPTIGPQEFNVRLKSLHEINSKTFNRQNAFSYNVWNILSDMIRARETIDFKTIGITIDACTKIIESKVDLVFTNVKKISSSLSMAVTSDNQLVGVDENGDEMDLFNTSDDNHAAARGVERRRRKQRKNIRTIASNLDSINGKPDINIEIDPLFHHLSAAFDVGNVNSLLMANLGVNPDGRILLDSNASLNFDDYQCQHGDGKLMKFSFLKPSFVFGGDDTTTAPMNYICKQCRDFEFLRRDVIDDQMIDLTNGQLIESQPNTEANDLINFDFDINANVGDIVDVDDDDVDAFLNNDNDFHSDLSSNQSEIAVNDNDGYVNDTIDDQLLNFLPNLADMNNQFFNRNHIRKTFNKLARYRNLLRNKQQDTNRNGNDGRKTQSSNVKSRKESIAIDYRQLINQNINNQQSHSTAQQQTLYHEQTISKWRSAINSETKLLLDMERDYHHGSYQELLSCFSFDLGYGWLVKNTIERQNQRKLDEQQQMKRRHSEMDDDDSDGGVGGFDLDHSDDEMVRQPTSDFNLEFNDHHHHRLNDLDSEPIRNYYDQQQQLQDEHVDPLDINYAKVAKKVDIKRVKLSMWSLIKQTIVAADQDQNQPEQQQQQEPMSSQSTQSSPSQNQFTFAKLRQNLPYTLRQHLNENLTTPISFVALLHLCNEKSLQLTPDELSDFLIDAPKN